MRRILRELAGATFLGLLAAACSLRARPATPLPLAATEALAEARELLRSRPEGWRPALEAALARAESAAPDWLAPRRVRDDLWREDLLGHLALAQRREELEAEPSAANLYLVGRLEGRAGFERFDEAVRLDPDLAWAQHGLAWRAYLSGQRTLALRAGRRARERARGSYELGVFAAAEARFQLARGEVEPALAGLRRALEDPRSTPPESTELEVLLARAELESFEREDVERGFWRAEALLRGTRLSEEECEELGRSLLAGRGPTGLPGTIETLLAALEHERSPARDRLRARLWIEAGAPALSAALLADAERPSLGAFARARLLERGAAQQALVQWCAALPAGLKDDAGLPREERLARLVRAADSTAESDGALAFGHALLEAGWFTEAGSWAEHLAHRSDLAPERALDLAGRASAGEALLAGIRGALQRVDGRREGIVPGRLLPEGGVDGPAEEARELVTLEELLLALEPFFERFHGRPLELDLWASPRLSYGGLASVVHPGPRFSALDEAEGRGRAGTPVPGLAAELARLGRFGIFGQAPGGGGPDGTVLRVVGGEWREGEHLGVRYSGWVAWCEGSDVESRPGRAGSSVSGAALHEGYWIDLESVRRDWERARAAESRFLGEDRVLLERALAARGPRLPAAAGPEESKRWSAPLGEGERVLLAALRERPEPVGGGTRLSFEEVLALTALHEEGHLTERTRFLPLSRHWPRALRLLLRCGLSPRALARRLEYRAQLVAMCEADDPRLVLAECLAASDGEGGVLTHGEAYRELVEDFLDELARALPPSLEKGHYLLFQLHFLTAEEVRRIALALARREGLPGD